jgi:hypothetical protein
MTDALGAARDSLMRSMDDAQEKYVLSVFGTRENLERYAHLYVLETEPAEFESSSDGDRVTFRATTRYRVRPKTVEELAANGE